VLEVLAQEGLWCDVASAGELHLALGAGFAPERLVVHGNARSDEELAFALESRAGVIVVDNFDDIDRLARLVDSSRRPAQALLVRVNPGVEAATHASIATGQADSKFGLAPDDARVAIARIEDQPGLELIGLHVHIGSQLYELEPFRAAIAALAGMGDFPVYDVGGGLGVPYLQGDRPPTVEEWVSAVVGAVHQQLGAQKRILVEPGRSLVANSTVTLYSVMTVKRNVSTWVAVDGGMSDNLRPMLYGARYEVEVADRFGGSVPCHVVGKHCESGDVLVRDALLDHPRVGDVLVMPGTGAYTYALANNYNGVPRPPVVFCRDGDARLVVRRETLDELAARDVH
jgi:diaminopimelate decarboxylase